MSFRDTGLSEKVLAAVEAAGYTEPTPIQAQAIPYALQGRDILGIAQTGTGKTAAFTLPMLSRLESGRARARMPRTLILEPTRELAAQVEESFVKYGVNQKLNVALLIGGVSFGALIGMQLLMRRPEIRGFISVAPPANMYDFSFLAPCPASGIFIQGTADTVVQPISVTKLVEKLRTQKHITIHHDEIPRANHFFENELEELRASMDKYLDLKTAWIQL